MSNKRAAFSAIRAYHLSLALQAIAGLQATVMHASRTSAFVADFRPATAGLMLAVLTILFGQGLGIIFGLNEGAIKGRIAADAQAVHATVYDADDARMQTVVDKSWAYMLRAHLHAGGMGVAALALIGLLCALSAPRLATLAISLALGAGGLGYAVFWMWAGFRAPGLGGTSAAKESLAWLAMPSAGAYVLGTIAVLGLLIAKLHLRPTSRVPTDIILP